MKEHILDEEITIQVPMQVTRYQDYGDVLCLWGFVGDYEVCYPIKIINYQTPGGLLRQLAIMPGEES